MAHEGDEFRELLGPALAAALDGHAGTAYGLWPDGRLAYFNPAWILKAQQNGGERVLCEWSLGRNVRDAIPPVLRGFYDGLWERALSGGRVEELDYECSTPFRHRTYRMRVEPIRGRGLLVRNELRVEEPQHAVPSRSLLATYVAETGFVTMCANCRRTRRADHDGPWDWVPDLVARPPECVSHGLCAPCLELYYPE